MPAVDPGAAALGQVAEVHVTRPGAGLSAARRAQSCARGFGIV